MERLVNGHIDSPVWGNVFSFIIYGKKFLGAIFHLSMAGFQQKHLFLHKAARLAQAKETECQPQPQPTGSLTPVWAGDSLLTAVAPSLCKRLTQRNSLFLFIRQGLSMRILILRASPDGETQPRRIVMYSSISVAGAALFGIVFAVTNLLAALSEKEAINDQELPPAA